MLGRKSYCQQLHKRVQDVKAYPPPQFQKLIMQCYSTLSAARAIEIVKTDSPTSLNRPQLLLNKTNVLNRTHSRHGIKQQ